MRGEKNRSACRGMPGDEVFDLLHTVEIDGCERFIENPQPRRTEQQPCQRDTPALASGELLRRRIKKKPQPNRSQRAFDADLADPAPKAGVPAKVLYRSESRFDGRIMTEVEAVAEKLPTLPRQGRTAPEHITLDATAEARDAAEKRGLARPVTAQDLQDLSGSEAEGQVTKKQALITLAAERARLEERRQGNLLHQLSIPQVA